MLSLRQFDSTAAAASLPEVASQLREHTASAVLEFGAQPSDSLPSFIASFAHPVHVDPILSETDNEAVVEGADEPERQPLAKTPSDQGSRLAPGRQSSEGHCVARE